MERENCHSFGYNYKIRKTYNINDLGFGIYGYDVRNEFNKFLYHFSSVENLQTLKNFIKENFINRYAETLLRETKI